MIQIIIVLIIFFTISMAMVVIYTAYMGNKNNQYPEICFDKFNQKEYNVKEIEQLVNKIIQGVKGWMWLATLFTALYYFLNFWSIGFMVINLILQIFAENQNKYFTVFLTLGSLMFTFLDLWLNTKEKSIKFNKHWFKTSVIAKKYVIKLCNAKTFEELCIFAIELNDSIYKENIDIDIL